MVVPPQPAEQRGTLGELYEVITLYSEVLKAGIVDLRVIADGIFFLRTSKLMF